MTLTPTATGMADDRFFSWWSDRLGTIHIPDTSRRFRAAKSTKVMPIDSLQVRSSEIQSQSIGSGCQHIRFAISIRNSDVLFSQTCRMALSIRDVIQGNM